jgi:hypothetical protein
LYSYLIPYLKKKKKKKNLLIRGRWEEGNERLTGRQIWSKNITYMYGNITWNTFVQLIYAKLKKSFIDFSFVTGWVLYRGRGQVWD